MSWLGDSFSSITGQLTNFTKEVLHEGREEVSDHATELSLATRRVQDLDSECNKLRAEVSRLRDCNSDLEERCRASELQASALLQQSRQLKVLHKARQPTEEENNEICNLKAKVQELESQLRECGERHLQQMSALQDHQEERLRQLHTQYLSMAAATPISDTPTHIENGPNSDDHQSKEFGSELSILSLQARVSFLEQKLNESQRQGELQAEQFRETRRNFQRTSRQLEKVQQEKLTVSQELAHLQESLSSSKLKDESEKKPESSDVQEYSGEPLVKEPEDPIPAQNQTASTQEQETNIKRLELHIAELEEELSGLQSEKEGLDSSLVELDGQHQEAVEQLLNVKQELQNDNKSLLQELSDLQAQNGCLQTEVETLREQLLGPTLSSLSSNEIQTNDDGKEKNDNLSSILQSVSDISSENLALEEKLEVLEKGHQKLELALFESEEGRQQLENNLGRRNEEILLLKEQLRELEELQKAAVLEMEKVERDLFKSKEDYQSLVTKNSDENLKAQEVNSGSNTEFELERLKLMLLQLKEKHAEREQVLVERFNQQFDEISSSNRTEKEHLESTLQKCKGEIETLTVMLSRGHEEMDSLKEDLKGKIGLEQALLKVKEERELLEIELHRANDLKHLSEVQLSNNIAEVQQLQSKVAELESIVLEKNVPSDNSYFNDSSQNPDLVTKLQQLMSENENLQNESDDLHVRLMETSGEKERLIVTVEELTEQNNDSQERVEQQKQVVDALELKMYEIEKSNAQSIDKLEQQLKMVTEEVENMKSENNVLNSKNKELTLNAVTTDSLNNRIRELEGLLVEGAQQKHSESASVQTEDLNEYCKVSVDQTGCPFHSESGNSENNTLDKNTFEQSGYEKKQLEVENQSKHSKTEDSNDKDVCDMKNLLKKKDSEIISLNSQLDSLLKQSEASSNYTQNKESEISQLKSRLETVMQGNKEEASNQNLIDTLRQVETEKEHLVIILNEKTRECSSLKAEVHKLVSFVSAEKQALNKLQQDNQELMRKQSPDSEMSKEVIQNLSRMIKDKDIEIEALKLKIGTLIDIAQQTDPEQNKVLGELMEEREKLSKQLKAYQADREQISVLLNQKHQESLRYHEEMQKMAVRLTTECQRYESLKEEHRSVSQLFEEKQKSLLNTQNEVLSLKQRVSDLERQHTDLRDKYKGLVDNSHDTVQVSREELEEKEQLQETLTNKAVDQDRLLSEKDQMIYDLNQALGKRETDSLRKDQALASLQNRMDSVQFQFNETLSRLQEAQNDCERLRLTLEKVKEEKSLLGETNRSLSMSLQKSHSEHDAMREKVGTLTQVMQTNMLSSDVPHSTSSSNQSDSVSKSFLLLERGDALEAQLQSLSQERDQVQLALTRQQQEKEIAEQEQLKLQKQNEKLHRELDRLRTHLLELQDNYTQEVMVAEEREKELRSRLSQAEDKASYSSSAIINASQQASLRVESLQSQLARVVRQRDASSDQVSQLEDRVQEQSAAHIKLQLALEHMQAAHSREFQELKHKQVVNSESYVQQIIHLKDALNLKEGQLADTSEALAAASRLSEQLDRKEEALTQLREEVTQARRQAQKLVEKIKEMESHSEGKVDKQIMKSLVLNYIQATPSQKPEMNRLLARILDFNQAEMEKVGINIVRESSILRPSGGWLSSFIHRVTPPTSPAHPGNALATTTQRQTQPSFSALFVQFLETESRPQTQLHIPIEEMTEGIVNRRGTVADIFPRTQLTPIKTITTTTSTTTTVVAEHPLMRPISTALPTFTPVISNENEATNSSVFLKEVLQ